MIDQAPTDNKIMFVVPFKLNKYNMSNVKSLDICAFLDWSHLESMVFWIYIEQFKGISFYFYSDLLEREFALELIRTLVQTVESPKGLSGNICPREVPRVIWLSEGPTVGKFSIQSLRTFHCFSDFGLQKPKNVRPKIALEKQWVWTCQSLTLLNPYFCGWIKKPVYSAQGIVLLFVRLHSQWF